jgi:hypothetical protein
VKVIDADAFVSELIRLSAVWRDESKRAVTPENKLVKSVGSLIMLQLASAATKSAFDVPNVPGEPQ